MAQHDLSRGEVNPLSNAHSSGVLNNVVTLQDSGTLSESAPHPHTDHLTLVQQRWTYHSSRDRPMMIAD